MVWISFPEIAPCHAPEFVKYNFRLNALLWISFPEIGFCHAPKFEN